MVSAKYHFCIREQIKFETDLEATRELEARGKCERLSPRLLLQDSNNKRDPPSQNSGRPLNALLRIVLPDDRRRDLPAGRYVRIK